MAGDDRDDFEIGALGSQTTRAPLEAVSLMPEQGVKAGESNRAKEVFDVVLHFPPPPLFSTILREMAQQSKRVHACGC